MEGSIALAEIESAGIRVDKAYLDKALIDIAVKIKEMESEMANDPVCKSWKLRFGERTRLGSREQLFQVLGGMGIRPEGTTATGRAQMTKASLDRVDLPFVRQFIRCEEMKKARSTYLLGIRKEMVDHGNGVWKVHPSFNLNTVSTFRSSANSPNVQNQPARNPEIAEIVRRCYIPMKGNHFAEVDYEQMEFRGAACYSLDPVLVKYCSDPATDVHRDMAARLFLLKNKQVAKPARSTVKNKFVFPQLFGDYHGPCAKAIWEDMERLKFRIADSDVLLKNHLASKGITRSGVTAVHDDDGDHLECDFSDDCFVTHVRREEEWFRNRFKAHWEWKYRWYDEYLNTGGFTMKTGFAVNMILGRNDVTNWPIQGASFHCLLWSLIRLVKLVRKYKMRTRLIGEIHDSFQADAPPGELNDLFDMARDVMTVKLPRAWDWIAVPLGVECEASPVGKSWFDKKVWVERDGVWGVKT